MNYPRLCAWCGKLIDFVPFEGSHGMCRACYVEHRKQLWAAIVAKMKEDKNHFVDVNKMVKESSSPKISDNSKLNEGSNA